MSVSAVGVAQVSPPAAKPRANPTVNDVAPFSQQLDSHTAQVQGHHQHVGASQSVASAAGSAGSAGGGNLGSLASSLLNLLS